MFQGASAMAAIGAGDITLIIAPGRRDGLARRGIAHQALGQDAQQIYHLGHANISNRSFRRDFDNENLVDKISVR